jgi:succinyl-CoA synthetase beta subunit
VPKGVFAFTVDELIEKAKLLQTEKFVLKAQIHAGGRGKAGGVKILDTIEELSIAAKELLGKTLITHQTGPEGREVKRLYVEESSNINKEFYLSCLIDRASSKIAFISSDQGGMDIEEVANKTPEKIITTKVEISDEISDIDCEEIVKIKGLTSIILASVLVNILYTDLISDIACFFASPLKLKILIISSQSVSETSSAISIFVVIIFSGVLLATSSMSIPP